MVLQRRTCGGEKGIASAEISGVPKDQDSLTAIVIAIVIGAALDKKRFCFVLFCFVLFCFFFVSKQGNTQTFHC